MFRSKSKATPNDKRLSADKNGSLEKYAKPKILLVDMPQSCEDVLRKAGYNATKGTFGEPYKIETSDEYHFVPIKDCSLPDLLEQDIVFVNTSRTTPAAHYRYKEPGYEVDAFWQKDAEIIDPRPLNMEIARNDFNKIFDHGALIIVFVSHPYDIEYRNGRRLRRYSKDLEKPFSLNNGSFLTNMGYINLDYSNGKEIEFLNNELPKSIKKGAGDAFYKCTIAPRPPFRDKWIPLAKNKYDEDVAGVLVLGDEDDITKNQFLFLLPQMPNFNLIIKEFLEERCALLKPNLFPYLERSKWVHRSEYEIPEVIEIQHKVKEIKQETKNTIQELESSIETVKSKNQAWYTLLNGTGDELCKAVINTLGRIGFKEVIDVDAEQTEGQKREDIQIKDQSPTLVVDVKGVQGHPSDDESRQSEKHATMRMREWDRTDVRPLTIINHQRNIPPRERDQQAYRPEIIANAEDTQLGLMTTWDLFKIMRNQSVLGWSTEDVLPIFYRTGRIDPVPEHYKAIGEIVEIWEPAFGIIPKQKIQVGDRIAIEIDDHFIEYTIVSLMVDKQPVTVAQENNNCGIAFDEASKKLRKGLRVFKITAT